jgi:hypothetical protein
MFLRYQSVFEDREVGNKFRSDPVATASAKTKDPASADILGALMSSQARASRSAARAAAQGPKILGAQISE